MVLTVGWREIFGSCERDINDMGQGGGGGDGEKDVFGSGTNRTCWCGGRRGEEFRKTRFWHEGMSGWQCLLVRRGDIGAKQILKGQIKP